MMWGRVLLSTAGGPLRHLVSSGPLRSVADMVLAGPTSCSTLPDSIRRLTLTANSVTMWRLLAHRWNVTACTGR